MGSMDYDERRGGRNPSILIAFIIAAVGFFMYMNQSEPNPITGEKQRVSLSPQQEIQLGLQSAPEMAAQMGGEVPLSDPRTQEVVNIGNKIVQGTNAHKGPWKFQFHLLKDPKTINAFALPGGQIFITVGLLNQLQTEAQLAGVLAHEVGHVIQRHSAQQLAKNQLGQILVMATGVGASDPSNYQRGQQAAMIAGVVNQMTQLHYGRGDELEADQWGLKLMTEIGYTPKAMLEVMQILEKASPGGYQPEMLLTHPYPKHREEYIKTFMKENPKTLQLSEGRRLKQVVSENESNDPNQDNMTVQQLEDLFFRR